MNKNINKKISKQEEARALNAIYKHTTSDPTWPKKFICTKKYDEKRSNDPDVPDEIYFITTYIIPTNPEYKLNYIIKIRKNDEGRIEFYLVHKGMTPDRESIIPGLNPLPLSEIFKKRPNLHINKEEELLALKMLRIEYKNDQRFKKTLKKIKHKVSTNPWVSDEIDYLGEFQDGSKSMLSIRKNMDGKLVYWILDPITRLPTQNKPIPLNENIPTGDWQSWGNITQLEKDQLKEILKLLQEYYKKYYSLVGGLTYVFLLKKVIDNLDTTDPRYAAKPLSKIPMEHRLMMMDFVDHKDTTGSASKVFDFLMDISREYIESPKPSKPDIELKGITDIVYPGGSSKGNVFISGINDMKPTINFGYGSYNLDKNFIDQFSKPDAYLYVDIGQGVKVVNMPEVMKKVEKAIDDYHKKNINLFESLNTKFQLIMKRGKREIFIGNFPSEYRARVVADGLGWDRSWKPIIIPINKISKISLKENFDNKFKLTREDEYRGLQFIRSFLLPEAIRSWNSYSGPNDQKITEEEARKNLKKKQDNQFNNFTRDYYSSYQLYLTKNSKELPIIINFFIIKSHKDGRLYISFQTLKGTGSGPYPLEENQIGVNLTKENKNFPNQTTITKEQLQQAVQIISKLTDNGERLGKTLKKVNVIPSDNPNVSDWHIYEATPHGNSIQFIVYYSWRRGLLIHDLTNNIQLINGKYPKFKK